MAEMTLKDWELQREMEEKAKEWLRSVVSPDLAGQRRPVGNVPGVGPTLGWITRNIP